MPAASGLRGARWAVVVAVAGSLSLSACQPPAAPDGGVAVVEPGYSRAPRFTAVKASEAGGFLLMGEAAKSGRVGVNYVGINSAGQAASTVIGVTSDGEGRFTAEVPSGPFGGIYGLFSDDRGRQMHAEGRLFVPAGEAGKAVLLRPGGASHPLSDERTMVAVADYDGAGGLALSGKIEPNLTVNLTVDGVIIGQARTDANGRYQMTAQISPPSETVLPVVLHVSARNESVSRTLPVSVPKQGERITRAGQGWRVDWNLPGGGIQTTVVF